MMVEWLLGSHQHPGLSSTVVMLLQHYLEPVSPELKNHKIPFCIKVRKDADRTLPSIKFAVTFSNAAAAAAAAARGLL